MWAPMALLVFLLAWLVLPAAAAAVHQQQHGRSMRHAGMFGDDEGWATKLPRSVRGWQYANLDKALQAQPAGLATRTSRWWDTSFLKRATTYASYEQLRPLMSKLHRGKPITVVLIGGTVVADDAGCWLPQPTSTSLPYVSRYAGNCSRGSSHGWAYAFMEVVGRAFPSTQHALVNVGLPGATLEYLAEAVCIDAYLPAEADLVVFEQHEWRTEPATLGATWVERLLWRVHAHFRDRQPHPPATVFLSTIKVAEPATRPEQGEDACLRDGRLCATACAGNFTSMVPRSWGNRLVEDVLAPLYQYYGASALSLRSFLFAAMRDGVMDRLGMTECTMLASLLADSLRPRELGRVLLADLLVNHLAEAESYFRALEDDNPTHKHVAFKLPTKAMMPGGDEAVVMRCYGTYGAEVAPRGPTSPSSLSDLTVLELGGWMAMDHPLHGSVKSYRPGWVSETPGSKLRFELDTVFAELAALQNSSASSTVVVVVTYVQAPEHMGQAEFTCHGGCECLPSRVDAHNTTQGHPVSMVHAFNVSQGERCVVQAELLQASVSGEHKFKIVQVTTKAQLSLGSNRPTGRRSSK